MATAGIVTKKVERIVFDEMPAGVVVNLSLSEARAIVALSGHVGGDPDGPRGLVDSAFGAICEALYPNDLSPWASAKKDLDTSVTGSANFSMGWGK